MLKILLHREQVISVVILLRQEVSLPLVRLLLIMGMVILLHSVAMALATIMKSGSAMVFAP
ncbi:hypothetical protein QJ54_25390 [Klebsiella pneumoniae]|nr:hypothetical protein KPNIH24_11200 [Klebsiella pneumoniae subsp. pneumoniae KPNIH24]AIE29294.1 hypothetical protein KPR0928_17035 [Klebsiella pneumoniae subsp. pneumoniae KPR0928]AIW71999.1 hypothetical protein KPNIH33_18170 [Klebsiella pneumoniae subsp. pneumoniae]AJB56909.1 hypothetical protein KU54_009005 [Klebsiella pneumoniae]AKR83056.1 hypothetical protein H218_09355 [Klebsiella pneumoniae DMC1097]AKR88580.1 hypothetical protein J052_08875 [Klebsiella pneumoniae 500_1420]AKR94072.1 h